MSFFKDATHRLTLLYVFLIFLLSLSYSVWLYNAAGNEISWVAMQTDTNGVYSGVSQVSDSLHTVHDSKARVLRSLVFFNFFVLGAGTLASYALAKYTLRPIQDAYEAQANFAMYASHELRTPLTALKAELQLAKRDTQTSQAMQHTIDSSLAEVERLNQLTGRLLRLANPSTPTAEMQSATLLDSIAAAEKALTILRDKAIEVKRPKHDAILAIAREDLTEVLTIIMHNAAKYGPKKSKIIITANNHGNLCEVRVQDSGPGIGPQDLPHIFDPFYRAAATKHQAGSGLGLAIAKSILNHAGASISATTGHGTTIILQIPIATSV